MILVLGAGGFIGTYLVDALLKNKFDVVASDISAFGRTFYTDRNIPFVPIDITDRKDFKKIEHSGIKMVIGLAALQPANVSAAEYDPVEYIRVNTIGTLNILKFARTVRAEKLIFAYSHRNTHGLWSRGKPIKEAHGKSLKYDGEYAMFSISESAAQDCIEHYRDQYGLRSVVFRLPPVYGYGPHTEIFKNGKYEKTGFLTFIENAMNCKPLEVWGDGSGGRDIVYVKDVVSAFIKALSSDKAAGLYNIASGKLLTVKEEAETIAKVFWACDSTPVIIPRPDIPLKLESFVYDIKKATRDLDWMPEYDFESMLRDYKSEMETGRFSHLIEKRKMMLDTQGTFNKNED